MFRTTVDGSFSKNDLENSSSHEEFSPLIDDKNEQLPLTENFLRERRSTSSSKGPGKEDILPDKRLRSPATGNEATKNSAERKLRANVFRFSPVNANRESSVIAGKQGYIAIDIKSPDSLDDYQNKGNKVLDIKVTKPSEEYHGGGHLIGSVSSSNRADGLIGNMNEGPHTTTDVTVTLFDHYLKSLSSQLFDICEGIDKACFYRKINFLYEKGYFYDVLLSQNEEGDTPLHVAVKKNKVDLTKEILRILEKPYNSRDSYKQRYFKDKKEKDKKENEKPLSKVINTKNRKGEDIITLVIKGNDPDCISTVLKYLTPEDLNRKKGDGSGYTPLHEAVCLKSGNAVEKLLESEHVEVERLDEGSYRARKYINDEETAELFIKYYDGKIKNLRKKLDDSDIQLKQAKRTLRKRKSIFSYSGVGSFGAQVCRVGFDVCRAVFDGTIGRILGLAVSSTLGLFASPPGLMVHLIHRTNEELSRYEEENSSLEKEFNNCREERLRVVNELRFFQERTSHRDQVDSISKQLLSVSSQVENYKKENEDLKKKLLSPQGNCSAQINSSSVHYSDGVFDSPDTQLGRAKVIKNKVADAIHCPKLHKLQIRDRIKLLVFYGMLAVYQ